MYRANETSNPNMPKKRLVNLIQYQIGCPREITIATHLRSWGNAGLVWPGFGSVITTGDTTHTSKWLDFVHGTQKDGPRDRSVTSHEIQ